MNEPVTRRNLTIGGTSKAELLDRLIRAGVSLNTHARTLFASDLFVVSSEPSTVSVIEVSVRELGFTGGATFNDLCHKAQEMGFDLCPTELGPHLRLQYTDQPEGPVNGQDQSNTAPSGSITVASAPLSENEDFPKGFYLRCIDGRLWLRGYRSGPDHVWQPDDTLTFLE